MAAFTSGADWGFPADLPRAEDLPGGWKQEVDYQDATSNHSSAPHANAPHTQPEPAAQEPLPKRRRKHYPPRKCRICLEEVLPTFYFDTESAVPAAMQPAPRVTYESEDGGRLFSPCKCKGSQKYVHEECLGAWRRADPTQKRNYWECPTCRFKYRLSRLTWSSWISSTAAQIGLTLFIFVTAIFLLGFVADPIINMYIDPVSTVATGGGPRGSLIFEDEPVTWTEHIIKGLASLGLLGFAKFMLTLSPLHWFNVRTSGMMGGGRSNVGGSGRDRLQQLGWVTITVGIITFLYAVWKGVRAWSRRALQSAGERVMDVPGADDDEDEEEDEVKVEE